jgi:hypothetical protein
MSTQVEPKKAVHASRDDVADGYIEEGVIETGELEEAVELEKPAPEEEPELSPREIIAQKHDKARRAEIDESKETFGQVEKPAESSVDKPGDTATIDPDEPEMVEIKVHGRPLMVAKEKVDKAGGIVAYQKEVAVMQGFKDVAAQKKTLAEREQALDEREQNLTTKEETLPKLDEKKPGEVKPTDPPEEGDQTLVDLADQYHQAYLNGDDDEARDLLLKLVAQPKQEKGIDPEELALQVAEKSEKIMEERSYNRDIFNAKTDLFKDHPELKTDTRLYTAVDDETEIVEREFPSYTPSQIMKEAYKRVSEWKGVTKPTQSTTLNDKADEKRAMNRPATSTRRADAPPKARKQTDSDYIKSLRKNRGQEAS